jgi:hypothetical protein
MTPLLSYQPAYPRAIEMIKGQLSVANTNEDGTGTMVVLYTAPAATECSFVKIRNLRGVARVTTTAGRHKFFKKTTATYTKLFDIVVSAITLAAGTCWSTKEATAGGDPATGTIPADIYLAPGDTLEACTHNAEAVSYSGEAEVY